MGLFLSLQLVETAAGKETKTAQFSLGSDSPCSAIALQSSMSGWKIPDS